MFCILLMYFAILTVVEYASTVYYSQKLRSDDMDYCKPVIRFNHPTFPETQKLRRELLGTLYLTIQMTGNGKMSSSNFRRNP